MAELPLHAWALESEPGQSGLTADQQHAVDQVLLAIATNSDRSPAAQGVIRAARALKRAQDDHSRAMQARDLDAAEAAAEMAREAEAALVRAVARMPASRSKPSKRSPRRLTWAALALG